jgi:MATE family multidrug resistance protein
VDGPAGVHVGREVVVVKALAGPEAWMTPRALFVLAFPAALTAMLHHAYRPLDQWFVSFLGREAQGALGAGVFVMILVYGAFALIAAGVGPLVARATGEGDWEGRRRILAVGLVGCALVALGLAVFGLTGVGWAVDLLGLKGLAAEHARNYLGTLFVTGAALAVGPTIDASFAASGDTRTPLWLMTAVIAGNAILTPIFAFGLDGGVIGAALGSTVAQTIGTSVGLALLARRFGLWNGRFWPPHATRIFLRIVTIGSPVCLGTAAYALVYWAMLATSITPLGDAVVAGLGIGFSGLEGFAWPLFLGCSTAAASVVGRCLGAGRVDLAREVVRRLFWPQVGLGVFVGLLFLTAGPGVARGFAADEAAWQEAVVYALVLAWSQPAVALEALYEGVLNGSGATRASFLATVPFNLLRIPLAWVLAFPLEMGPAGVWWAINITSYLKAGTKGGIVAWGAWAS